MKSFPNLDHTSLSLWHQILTNDSPKVPIHDKRPVRNHSRSSSETKARPNNAPEIEENLSKLGQLGPTDDEQLTERLGF